jgi:sensor histidine kinase YesM
MWDGNASPPHATAIAVDALRGIGRKHAIAAALFGLGVSVANIISFYVRLVVDAKPISHTIMIADMLIQDQVRAFALMAAIVIADHAVDLGARMRRCYVAAALGGGITGVLASAVLSWPFSLWMQAHSWPAHWLRGTQQLALSLLFSLTHWPLIASAAVFLYAEQRAARRTEARLNAAQLDRIRRSRRALESRLQAMQARVEPQFLFNTLAQVERLFESDAALAGRMLDDLIAYLRAAMPRMRDTSSTAGREIELVRAYLAIVRVRLGDRLHFSIDMPEVAADMTVPPMMLLPLVDHAIVHGLKPDRAGGTIRIGVKIAGAHLHLSIVDSGAGFVRDADDTGIQSIRERLSALYGAEARLELAPRVDGGTEARLELPCEVNANASQPP